MNSDIALYNTPLTPEKNAWIDKITDFLNPLQIYSIPNMQYIKHGVNIKVKLNAAQAFLYQFNINYAKIQNSDDRFPFYYFVIDFKWTSSATIELTLSLDTINTFLRNKQAGEIFTSKTNIIREHLDRFYYSTGTTLQRKVHRVSEGISPMLYKSSDKIINGVINDNFYLVYRTRKDLTPENIANPVECFCVADEPLKITHSSGTGEPYPLNKNTFTAGQTYYLDSINNPNLTIKQGDRQPEVINELVIWAFQKIKTSTIDTYQYKVITFKREGTLINYDHASAWLNPTPTGSGLNITIMTAKSFGISGTTAISTSYNDIINLTQRKHINAGTTPETSTIPFKDLDRTDNRIVKIIKLPYAPTDLRFSFSNELIYDREVWEFSEGMLKLKDLNISFYNMINLNAFNVNAASSLNVDVSSYNAESSPSRLLESKLYHSDFFIHKLVYDTFSYTFKHENISTNSYPETLPVSFKITNTINSKMLFSVENLSATRPVPYKYYDETDYEGVINVARNNEVVIFNNDYVNYIKSGYNYDKKSIKQQEAYSWTSTGIQIAGAVVGAIVSGATGNPISAAASIAMGAGAVASFASNINSNISNERNMEAKLAQLAHQRSNVIGSDDVDLLNQYNGNRLHEVVYKLSPETENAIFNLFFYTGYSNPINNIPDLNSRTWFNFIQCKPVYTKDIINEIPKNYLDDITARLGAGVTRYHQHNGGYNIDQNKENLETWLVN